MRKEHELIMLSVLINKTDFEIRRIDELLAGYLDWVEIAGVLMNHRLAGYFYYGLNDKQRSYIPKELKNNLNMIVNGQDIEQKNRYKYINELFDTLENKNIRYAGLKGLIYGATMYDSGIRRSNDIDLLVYEDDLGKLDYLLRSIGYIQSTLPNGELIEATKKEKMIQRMNYHDLIPYVKETDEGIIEVDINFLFDGKYNLIDSMVFEKGTFIYEKQYRFRGLAVDTNLSFLICHFYREATDKIWINNKRNFILYKIVDIVNFIRYNKNQLNIDEIFLVFEKLNILEKAAYTIFTINMYYSFDEFLCSSIEYLKNNYSDIYEKYYKSDVFEHFYKGSFDLGR